MSETVYYVSIGNSDNRLIQQDWARYVEEVDRALSSTDTQLHGRWFSAGDSPFQNACWCFQVSSPGGHNRIRKLLRSVARRFLQDSIAWGCVENPEFLTPLEVGSTEAAP